MDDENDLMSRKADDAEPFSALAFKVMSDPFVESSFSSAYTRASRTAGSVMR